MALNKYMHPRNHYKNKKASFQLMAIKYPEFRKHVYPDVSGKLFLDFTNPESLRQLSTTLMKEDFGLDVELPPDRLVPTIPLRLNYILWIEDILKDSSITGDIAGIDIGTGGSCVYPLLSTSMNKWKFLATEVDETNYEYAVKNVNKNNFAEFVKVVKVEESTILLDVLKDTSDIYHFCMCNPPFFTDHLEAQGITNSRSDDRPEAHSVNTASSTESVAFGGEVEFVKKMIHESMELKSKVRVFTSMVGKKSSLSPLKEELRKLKISNFSTTEFCQGKTMRWGIGWTFDEGVHFPKSQWKEQKKEKRPPLSYIVPEETPNLMYTTEGVAYQLKELLKQLEMKWVDKKSTEVKIAMVITAQKNTWSHQRRMRRLKRLEKKADSGDINQNKKSDISGKSENDENLDALQSDSNDSSNPALKPSIRIGSNSQKTASRKRKPSDKLDGNVGAKVSKINSESMTNLNDFVQGSNNTNKMDIDDAGKIQECCDKTDRVETTPVIKTEKSDACNFAADHTSDKSDPGASGLNDKTQDTQTAASDEKCILKCNLNVKQIEDEQVAIEMVWVDGTCRESMNQVLQYFKNQLQKINPE